MNNEPVAYLYHDAGSLKELMQNERKRLNMNSVSISFLKNSNSRNETPLYSQDYVNQLLGAHHNVRQAVIGEFAPILRQQQDLIGHHALTIEGLRDSISKKIAEIEAFRKAGLTQKSLCKAELTDEEKTELENALKVCEYKYFGSYPLSEKQWEAFELLEKHAKAILKKAQQ
ncbi:MAG: hypothetical protein V4536_08545 [Pseudomonadota bacterium]